MTDPQRKADFYAGLRHALQLIADLPTGRTEDVMEGHEEAYRVIEAEFAIPPRITKTEA